MGVIDATGVWREIRQHFLQSRSARRIGDEQVTVPAGHTAIEVADPLSGIRYGAIQKTGEPDTAATMLVKDAKAQVEANQVDAAVNTIQDLDLMRGMYEIYGRAF